MLVAGSHALPPARASRARRRPLSAARIRGRSRASRTSFTARREFGEFQVRDQPMRDTSSELAAVPAAARAARTGVANAREEAPLPALERPRRPAGDRKRGVRAVGLGSQPRRSKDIERRGSEKGNGDSLARCHRHRFMGSSGKVLARVHVQINVKTRSPRQRGTGTDPGRGSPGGDCSDCQAAGDLCRASRSANALRLRSCLRVIIRSTEANIASRTRRARFGSPWGALARMCTTRRLADGPLGVTTYAIAYGGRRRDVESSMTVRCSSRAKEAMRKMRMTVCPTAGWSRPGVSCCGGRLPRLSIQS